MLMAGPSSSLGHFRFNPLHYNDTLLSPSGPLSRDRAHGCTGKCRAVREMIRGA
jgi:hypothetical protein